MKSGSYRLMKAEDVGKYNEDGKYEFNKRFRDAEIKANRHFLVEDKGVILQFNTDYSHVGCHDRGFERVNLVRLTNEDIETLIRNIHSEGWDFSLNIDTDDESDDYYRYDLEILTLKDETIDEYLKRLTECMDELRGVLIGIIVRGDKGKFRVDCYLSGAGYVQNYNREESLSVEDYVDRIIKWYGLADTIGDVEEIPMLEKEVVSHEYSQLHILVDYIEGIADTMPEEVVNAWKQGEKSLKSLANTYKDAEVYKR